MSVNTNFSTNIRASALAANTNLSVAMSAVSEGFDALAFIIDGAAAGVTVSDVQGAVVTTTPLERLIFNNTDIARGWITLNTLANTFDVAAGRKVVVGMIGSASHASVRCSVATTVLAAGRNMPAKV
jgi:hypothetical protein